MSLKIAAQHGFNPPFLRFFESVRDDSSACAAAMRSGQRIIVEDVANSDIFDDQSRKIMLEAEARAVVSVPLTSSRDMLLGMMSVHFKTPHRPSEPELTRLELVARQTADYLERKRAEEAERTLGRELQHRSENVLAVFGSMARRTLSKSHTLEDAAEALDGRLRALGRANRADSGWHNVDLTEIVSAELSIFSGRTSFKGSKIELDPQYGQRFALLMHELMTNAIEMWRIVRSERESDSVLAIEGRRSRTDIELQMAGKGRPAGFRADKAGIWQLFVRVHFPREPS